MNSTKQLAYERAWWEWQQRVRNAKQQRRYWRLAAILLMLAAVFLLIGLMMSASQHRQHVYIAQAVGQQQATRILPLNEPYQLTDGQNKYFITHFLELIMTLPLDPVLIKTQWLEAFEYVQGRAHGQLAELAKRLAPLNEVGKITQTVDVQQVQQVTPGSYEARWRQVTYDADGKVTSDKEFRGVFTLTHQQPQTLQQIMVNPLGLRITYINLTQQ
jgi:type IV secretion system protein VirB5